MFILVFFCDGGLLGLHIGLYVLPSLVVILVPEEDLFYWGVEKGGLAYPR